MARVPTGARVTAVLTVLLFATAVWAEVAAGCSCADRDERDRLEAGEKALVGRVVAERRIPGGPRDRLAYRVRVERGIGVRLRREVEVTVAFPDCGTPQVGERQAMFVRRAGSGWRTDGCSIVDPTELLRATQAYPRPRGSGRAALLAGGRFGTARVMALDARGRVIGYGDGRGEARRLSVCPGSRLAAELFADGRTVGVAVRDLKTLRVVRSARLPVDGTRLSPESSSTVNCADPQAASVHAGISDYVQRTRFDRVRIFRLDAGGLRLTATMRGSTMGFGADSAFVGRFGFGVVAVSLEDGETELVSSARAPQSLAVSPDGTRLAFYDRSGLRLVDLTGGGADRRRRIGYGDPITWLAPHRLLFRKAGEGRVYDRELRLVRRYRFFRARGQAQVGDTLYGTDRYRLRSLDLPSGRKRTVAQLPDRGVLDLAALPALPAIEPGRARPAAPVSASARSSPCRTRDPRRAR